MKKGFFMKSFKVFLEDFEIKSENEKEIVAYVTGQDSRKFTLLAQKLFELAELERKVQDLREEIKTRARQDVASLFEKFNAESKTRRVETQSVILTLSKNPEPRKTVAWKSVVDELYKLLTDYQDKIEETIQKFTKYVAAEPSITAKRLDEAASGFVEKLKMFLDKIFKFFKNYDIRLMKIKRKIRKYGLAE